MTSEVEKQGRVFKAKGTAPVKRLEGVVQSEDGVTTQEGAWGPRWWEMRLDRQVVARLGRASGPG